jgi:hypothetical protein
LIDDRPTIAERYSLATQTSDLKLREGRCAADYLVAAGLAGDTLGSVLHRVKIEFDTARGEYMAAQVRAMEASERAAVEAESVQVGPTMARKITDDADSRALTDRAFIMLQMPSLREAKDRLGAWGIARASFRGYVVPAAQLAKIIGRVLDVYLDPNCSPCEGRGFTGGGRGEHSGPRMRCSSCGETGKRKQRLGKDDAERAFAGELLAHMDRMVCDVEAQMSRFLRSGA